MTSSLLWLIEELENSTKPRIFFLSTLAIYKSIDHLVHSTVIGWWYRNNASVI